MKFIDKFWEQFCNMKMHSFNMHYSFSFKGHSFILFMNFKVLRPVASFYTICEGFPLSLSIILAPISFSFISPLSPATSSIFLSFPFSLFPWVPLSVSVSLFFSPWVFRLPRAGVGVWAGRLQRAPSVNVLHYTWVMYLGVVWGLGSGL